MTGQYRDAGGTGQGVVLGAGPTGAAAGAPATVESLPSGAAASGTRVASIAGCCKEFNPYGVWGRFPGGAKRLVRVRVGAEAASIAQTVKLVGVSAAGADLAGVVASALVPADGQVKTPLQIEDPQARIAFFKIVYGSVLSPGILGLIPPQHKVDDLGYDVAATPPAPDFALVLDSAATLGAPLSVARGGESGLPARIVVSRFGGSSGSLTFSATGLPPGVQAIFAPNDAANPGEVLVRLKAGTAAKASLGGSFSVTATPTSPGSGSGARTVSVPFTVVENYDLAVAGIDVTQGIQSDGNLPGRPPGSLLPFLAAYDGLPLAARKTTVARVFAVVAAPAKTTVKGATFLLYGSTGAKPLPGSPLVTSAEVPAASVNVGSDLVNAGGRRAAAAARFSLPPSWTAPGKVTLRAKVLPPTVLFGGSSECTVKACGANNEYALAGVPFNDTGFLNVAALHLKVAGQAFPAFPDLLLSRFADLVPLADGQLRRVDDWRAEYDVTAIANAATYAALPGGCPFLVGALCGLVPDLDALLIGYAVDFRSGEKGCDNLWQPLRHSYCFDAVMGMVNDKGIGNKDGSAGLAKGGRAINGLGARAVANLRRPLTSIAHELGHGFGLQHASPGCKGGADGQKASTWPDDWGTIQGLGYDVRDGTIVAAGTAPTLPPRQDKPPFPPLPGAPTNAWYDFMSYCADNSQELNSTVSPAARVGNSWISTINWKSMLNTLRGLKRSSAKTASAPAAGQSAAAAAGRRTLFAFGLVEQGQVALTNIGPGTGIPSPAVPSPYRLILRDGAGAALAETPMVVQSSEGHGKERVFVSAELPVPGDGTSFPSQLAAVEVRDAVGVVGGRRRSANPPTVQLARLRAGARIGRGRTTTVRWKASDRDGDQLTATLEYSLDDGRSWRILAKGPDRGGVTVPSRLLAGSARARLRVRVNDGFDENSSTSPRLVALGRPPRVRILSPRPAARVTSADHVALTAAAHDDRGNAIASRRVRWFDGRRALPGGASANVRLRPGTHRLRAVATDARGRRGTATFTVRVRAIAPRIILDAALERIPAAARSLRLRVSSDQPAALRTSGSSVSGTRRLGTITSRTRTVIIPLRNGGPIRLSLRASAFGRTSTIRLELERATTP